MVGLAGTLLVPMVNTVLLALSPQSLIHLAEYVPAPTLIVLLVEPVLHWILPLPQPLACKVAVSAAHTTVLSLVKIGVEGKLPNLMIIALLTGLEPQRFSQVAVYVPAVLTVILVPLAFVLHFTVPIQPVAVKVAVPVPQIIVVVEAITGAAGLFNICITTGVELSLVPQLLIHFTL